MTTPEPGPGGLTHVDATGAARMVDVGDKEVTRRVAVASGTLHTTAAVCAALRDGTVPKGDALATARIAGIMGAKRTPDLIPLCHPIPLAGVTVDLEVTDDAVAVVATARSADRTGVEMEALTAVAVAGLALHDMIKAVDPAATLTEVRLESKTGGSRGDWSRAGGRTTPPAPRRDSAAVLVVSTRSASGARKDATGPVLAAWLAERGLAVDPVVVAADADVAEALERMLATRPSVLITTGGTGLGPGDRTPDATAPLLDRELPGVAEAIRARGLASTPTAALSRGLAGVAGDTIVVNLPGSPGGVRDGIAVLDGLLDHLRHQLAGHADHAPDAPSHD